MYLCRLLQKIFFLFPKTLLGGYRRNMSRFSGAHIYRSLPLQYWVQNARRSGEYLFRYQVPMKDLGLHGVDFLRSPHDSCVSDSLVKNDKLSFFSTDDQKTYLGNKSSQQYEIFNTPGGHQDLLPVPTDSLCDHAHFRFGRPNAFGFAVEYL